MRDDSGCCMVSAEEYFREPKSQMKAQRRSSTASFQVYVLFSALNVAA
jgi:hypothetical protein